MLPEWSRSPDRVLDIQAIPLFVAVRDIWHLGFHLGNAVAGREWWWLDDAYLERRLQAMRSWTAEELHFTDSGL